MYTISFSFGKKIHYYLRQTAWSEKNFGKFFNPAPTKSLPKSKTFRVGGGGYKPRHPTATTLFTTECITHYPIVKIDGLIFKTFRF